MQDPIILHPEPIGYFPVPGQPEVPGVKQDTVDEDFARALKEGRVPGTSNYVPPAGGG